MSESQRFSASNPEQLSSSETRARYQQVLKLLLDKQHVFYSPPTSPHKLLIAQDTSKNGGVPTIASLSLHPVLEAQLHLLNCDLPSAHFLCRHAEVAPKYESMYVHGILHRIEGDIDNTRAWYKDVHDTDMFTAVWETTEASSRPEPCQEGWKNYLNRCERWRDRTQARAGKNSKGERDELQPDKNVDWKQEEELLREASLWEMKEVLRFLENKFGVQEVKDANKEFLGRVETGDKEQARMAQNMVTGGEGWRTF